jgi:DNA-directed RNA polymerase specialized sigma24 family protein
VAEEAGGTHNADDARLLSSVRLGNVSAFGTIRQRHQEAARRLAGELAASPAEADEVVAEAFARVLAATQRGGGPSDAFRPYLLTAVRRVLRDRQAGGGHGQLLDTDPGQLLVDPEVAGPEHSTVARAFLSLPDRWIAVLWHAEIEEASASDVAPLLGLSRSGVAAVRRRARAGLRQSALHAHMTSVTGQDCTAVTARLGTFVQDAVSGRDSALVTDHLSQCGECRAVYAELADMSLALRVSVAPLFLGSATAAYLRHDADTNAATADAVSTTGGLALWSGLRDRIREASLPVRWLAAGAAVVVAIAAVAIALTLNARGTPPASAGPDPGPAASRSPARTSAVSPQTPTSSSPKPDPRSSPRPATLSAPSAHPSSTAASSSAGLSPSVNMYGLGDDWTSAEVVFGVSNSGSDTTSELTVSLALPAGTSVIGGSASPGPGAGVGWLCAESGTVATCQHAGIAASADAQGGLFLAISGTSACGDAVRMSVRSGSGSASTESSQSVQC